MQPIPAVHHPDYTFPLPARHPFPMEKFRLLRQHLDALGDSLEWHQPTPISLAALKQVHDADYIEALVKGQLDERAQRRSGFPWSEALVRRVRLETGGTLLGARLALTDGLALNAAGGTHHAHADFASGYCLINDLAVVAMELLRRGEVERLLIIDLDVHQGDGTARLLANEPRAFTFSMHAGRNFPARKASSDEDIALESATADDAYLAVLQQAIPRLIQSVRPGLVIYDAGADVHKADRLGHLALTDTGLRARDAAVIETVRGAGLPLLAVIGGGYDRDTPALVARHAMVFEEAVRARERTPYNEDHEPGA
ncbi:histone deacetylase family protein [Spiribacter salinus]|nr:histone deacetylase [Spiribacter salinus]